MIEFHRHTTIYPFAFRILCVKLDFASFRFLIELFKTPQRKVIAGARQIIKYVRAGGVWNGVSGITGFYTQRFGG